MVNTINIHCVIILEESFCIGTYSSNVVIDIKLPAGVTETRDFPTDNKSATSDLWTKDWPHRVKSGRFSSLHSILFVSICI